MCADVLELKETFSESRSISSSSNSKETAQKTIINCIKLKFALVRLSGTVECSLKTKAILKIEIVIKKWLQKYTKIILNWCNLNYLSALRLFSFFLLFFLLFFCSRGDLFHALMHSSLLLLLRVQSRCMLRMKIYLQ